MEESVASNSPDSPTSPLRRGAPSSASTCIFNLSQQLADRAARALSHGLRLLHRSSPSDFFVLGFTGNVYKVILSPSLTCTCPDRIVPCKHILFVLLKVLGLPLDDPCLRRRYLHPCQLQKLLSTPSSLSADVVAGQRAWERFRQIFLLNGNVARVEGGGDGRGRGVCPVCLEEMEGGKGEGDVSSVLVCGTCGNGLHKECLLRWKRSGGRRTTTCVMCRSRWRERSDKERYVNLAAYAIEGGGAGNDGGGDDGGRGNNRICTSSG